MKDILRYIHRGGFLFMAFYLFNSANSLYAQWVQCSGISGSAGGVRSFAVINGDIFAGTYAGGVYLSTNSGTSWTLVDSTLANTDISALAVIDSNIFAGTSDGVYISTNSGTSWTAVNKGLTNTDVYALAVSGSNIFAGTWGGGVFLSTTSGTSWTSIDSGLTSKDVGAFAINGSSIFAGTYGGVYLSTNSGTSWTATALINNDVYALAISDSTIFAGTQNGNAYRSTNSGSNWTAVLNNYVYGFAVIDGNIFAGTNGGGVFLSTNSGSNWVAVNSGLTDKNLYALAISNNTIVAGTATGAWRRPLSDMITGVNNNKSLLPQVYTLEQNFPNPFNPTTVIRYQLPIINFITLKVYDVLGKELKTLVNERQQAGTCSIRFNAANLPSGVYFYRLQAGSFTQTKKLVLLK